MATEIVELPAGTARTLRRKDDQGVTTLTLNRPKSGNSLSHQLVHELQDTLDEIRDDRSVRGGDPGGAGAALLHRPRPQRIGRGHEGAGDQAGGDRQHARA